jgi:hypothetical protein
MARERAIGRAYMVAGDEDLRESVVEAQRHGIQVVLLGMHVSEGQNQSSRLVRDCDEYVELPPDVWQPFCSLRTAEDDEPAHEDIVAVRQIARTYAQGWLSRHDNKQTKALLANFPDLPRDLDVDLVHAAEESLGSMRQRTQLRSELRGTFRLALRQEFDRSHKDPEGAKEDGND